MQFYIILCYFHRKHPKKFQKILKNIDVAAIPLSMIRHLMLSIEHAKPWNILSDHAIFTEQMPFSTDLGKTSLIFLNHGKPRKAWIADQPWILAEKKAKFSSLIPSHSFKYLAHYWEERNSNAQAFLSGLKNTENLHICFNLPIKTRVNTLLKFHLLLLVHTILYLFWHHLFQLLLHSMFRCFLELNHDIPTLDGSLKIPKNWQLIFWLHWAVFIKFEIRFTLTSIVNKGYVCFSWQLATSIVFQTFLLVFRQHIVLWLADDVSIK